MEEQKEIKVLLVDDEKMIHIMLRRLFNNQQDLKVMGSVCNGKEAIKFVRQHTPDAIIMDVNMPIMNGLEATRRITDHMPHPTVIGLSFQDNTTVIEDMLKAGASAYITKDEASEKICATIRREVILKKNPQEKDDNASGSFTK